MSPSPQRAVELFIQSEQNYLQFLNSFLTMQISFLQTVTFFPWSPFEQRHSEQQLIASLTTMEKLLANVQPRNLSLESESDPVLTNELKDAEMEIEYLLLELEFYLKKHPFARESTKERCIHALDQLSKYFYQNRIRMIDDNPELPNPWIHPSVKTAYESY